MTKEMPSPINYYESSWKQRYKIRLKYIKKQEGKCCHCGGCLKEEPHPMIRDKVIETNLFPESMFDHLTHLHYDYKTGMTLGVVHSKCLAILWQYYGY